ncbi:MAG: hypothetical protein R3B52_00785 [Candidatus Paceibacterota bacterium]
MDSLLKSDIFFIVTTAMVILVALAVLVILFYLFRIVRTAKKVSDEVAKTVDHIAKDTEKARSKIKTTGLSGVVEIIAGTKKKKRK